MTFIKSTFWTGRMWGKEYAVGVLKEKGEEEVKFSGRPKIR